MSYIRCTSNAEGLYIVGQADGVVVYRGGDTVMMIPTRTFRGLFQMLNRRYGWLTDKMKYGELLLSQTEDFQWRLSYKGKHIDLYETTLMYILTQNDWHPEAR